jgi:hypothetical protein
LITLLIGALNLRPTKDHFPTERAEDICRAIQQLKGIVGQHIDDRTHDRRSRQAAFNDALAHRMQYAPIFLDFFQKIEDPAVQNFDVRRGEGELGGWALTSDS